MAEPSVLYATDEDIAVRAGADWPAIVPDDQSLAYGTDGAFDPGGWVLTSATVDFAAAGAAARQVVMLSQKLPAGTVSPIRGVELLVVDSAPGPGAVLRRKGLASAAGRPPAGAAGAAGVVFDLRTLAVQVGRASYDLNRQFGIDDAIAGRGPADLYDVLQLRDLCCLTVLYRAYLAACRDGQSSADVLLRKSNEFKAELDDVAARVQVKWSLKSRERDTGRFNTRIGR